MTDFLIPAYPYVKFLHIISVISWMAGLFYLPRLFVHHAESAKLDSDADLLLRKMEKKLLTVIMNPAMGATWVFGLLLALTPGVIQFESFWVWMKLAAIISMSWFHSWLAVRQKEFEQGENTRSGKTYRIMNELPTVLMIIIVFMVVVKPF